MASCPLRLDQADRHFVASRTPGILPVWNEPNAATQK